MGIFLRTLVCFVFIFVPINCHKQTEPDLTPLFSNVENCDFHIFLFWRQQSDQSFILFLPMTVYRWTIRFALANKKNTLLMSAKLALRPVRFCTPSISSPYESCSVQKLGRYINIKQTAARKKTKSAESLFVRSKRVHHHGPQEIKSREKIFALGFMKDVKVPTYTGTGRGTFHGALKNFRWVALESYKSGMANYRFAVV